MGHPSRFAVGLQYDKIVAMIKKKNVTAETRKFPAILTQDRTPSVIVVSLSSSFCGTPIDDDTVWHPSNHAFRITLLLDRLSNIYGANTNWNNNCKQMDITTKVTERFRPDVGLGRSWHDFSFPHQDDSTEDIVEQQHHAAQQPNCRAFFVCIYICVVQYDITKAESEWDMQLCHQSLLWRCIHVPCLDMSDFVTFGRIRNGSRELKIFTRCILFVFLYSCSS